VYAGVFEGERKRSNEAIEREFDPPYAEDRRSKISTE